MRTRLVAHVTLILICSATLILAQNGNDLFQQALDKERGAGDIPAAIKIYERIVKDFASNRPVAAKALFQMGQAYEKLGKAEARKAYERIAREFRDQKEVAAEAGRRLAALDGAQLSKTLTGRLVGGPDVADREASITPDGRLMALTDWSTGDLAIRDMATGQMRRLMAKAGSSYTAQSPEFGIFPVLSRDLRQVAYTWGQAPEPHYQLRVMANEAGGKPRVLISSPEFSYFRPSAWSQDGKSILTILWKQDHTAQLAWVSATDGSIKVLKSLEWRLSSAYAIVAVRASLSPDGRFIAYSALARPDSFDTHIYVLAADGSSGTELVNSPGINETPVWAPDGAHLVFVSDRSGTFGLWSVATRDGKAAGAPSLVKSEIGRISTIGFTSSGSYYYVHEHGVQDVFVADLDPASGKIRGSAVPLSERSVGSNRDPAWSSDDKFIAFLRRPDELVVHKLDETGEEKVYAGTPAMQMTAKPIWSRDGKTLLQAIRDRQRARLSLYRVDLKTGEFREVVALSDSAFAVSPDEKTVYFYSNDASQVKALDIATGLTREVFTFVTAPKGGYVSLLALSPDGRTLALKYGDLDINHLSLVGVDGSNFRDLYTVGSGDGTGIRPAWTKDGRAIFFGRNADGVSQLMRIPAEGGTPEFTGLTVKGSHYIDLNADGSRIAFSDGGSPIRELWALDNLTSALKTAR